MRSAMIADGHGNLLLADVEALVNTVNTVGIMGKGIALQFRKAYPEMFAEYESAASAAEVRLGRMHVWETQAAMGPRLVINFPTKKHWKSRSRLTDIAEGLDDLVRVIRELKIRSIAVPPLGCGHGGLDWRDVEPLIRSKLSAIADVEVVLFGPEGAPPATEMVVRGPAPTMSPARAALIEILVRYSVHALGDASLIEVQKLMYFLQIAGVPLSLDFRRHLYGPYSDRLRHVLVDVEGHYLSGFGDGSNSVAEAESLTVLPGALDAARIVLADHAETSDRMERVLTLIEGFESADSLELLATMHLLMAEDPRAVDDVHVAMDGVRAWSQRKSELFSEHQMRVAWAALRDRGWTPVLA